MTGQKRSVRATDIEADAGRRGRRDAGDETARNFRYQHSYGVILLAAASRGDLPYAAIWCERHEDMSVLNRDNAPHDWSYGCRHMAATALLLLKAEIDPGVDRLRVVLAHVGDAAEFADTYLDGDAIVQTLELQAAVAAHAFERGGNEGAELIGAVRERLRPRIGIYRHTPFNLLFQLADGQCRFILGYLATDRTEMEQAIAMIRASAAEPVAVEHASLVDHADEVLIEMEERLKAMPVV